MVILLMTTRLMTTRLMTRRLTTMMPIHAASHDQYGEEWINSMAISLMATGSREIIDSITVMSIMVMSAAAPRRSSAVLRRH